MARRRRQAPRQRRHVEPVTRGVSGFLPLVVGPSHDRTLYTADDATDEEVAVWTARITAIDQRLPDEIQDFHVLSVRSRHPGPDVLPARLHLVGFSSIVGSTMFTAPVWRLDLEEGLVVEKGETLTRLRRRVRGDPPEQLRWLFERGLRHFGYGTRDGGDRASVPTPREPA